MARIASSLIVVALFLAAHVESMRLAQRVGASKNQVARTHADVEKQASGFTAKEWLEYLLVIEAPQTEPWCLMTAENLGECFATDSDFTNSQARKYADKVWSAVETYKQGEENDDHHDIQVAKKRITDAQAEVAKADRAFDFSGEKNEKVKRMTPEQRQLELNAKQEATRAADAELKAADEALSALMTERSAARYTTLCQSICSTLTPEGDCVTACK
mmetsp:Transcript_35762/g.56981  ORF Transcript_35762/g.56981 Transcript_35762/m.56981 type:complete len:217 (-) Transcript_35762:83-733(-)